jgi:nudix-type nucleoside diphosphatase (YffH/AdpP family)
MSYAVLSTKTAYEGWSTLFVATIRTPDGATIKREIEDHGTAVAVLPYDPERRVAMLVRQFRPPVFQAAGEIEMLEAPAGLIEEDHPEDSVRREADEEVGIRLGELEPIGPHWSMPGLSTERLHLYLAPYRAADRTGAGGGLAREHENITPAEIGFDELVALADSGRLSDLKTFALVQTLRLRHPHLFEG